MNRDFHVLAYDQDMKKLLKTIQILSVFLLSTNANANFLMDLFKKELDLYSDSKTTRYSKRDVPIIKVALIGYGTTSTKEDLERMAPKLVEKFSIATAGEIELDVKHVDSYDFLDYKLGKLSLEGINDRERLKRISYSYDKRVVERITREAYKAMKTNTEKKVMKEVDLMLLVTGAQFEGLGIQHGRFAIVEHPREIAFELPNGNRVEYLSDEAIVSELIHEVGHSMGLMHAAAQCNTVDCCEQSENADDIMSYCRDRKKVEHNDFMFVFEQCHLNFIREKFKPILLEGGSIDLSKAPECL